MRLLVVAALALSGTQLCDAQQIPVRVTVEPQVARLGQQVRYHAYAVLPAGLRSAKWLPPEADEDVTWGQLRPSRTPGPALDDQNEARARDTLHLRATLQVFRTGSITIPGAQFQIEDTKPATVHRLPSVTFEVASVLPADEQSPQLLPARGPLEAPWWERVPWRWVALGAAAIGLGLAFFMARRRRKPDLAPVRPVAADPAAEALAALATLRKQGLAAQGRFAEHAWVLSGIARRYLEATALTPQPGDTTPELIAHLSAAALGADDLLRLEALLRRWDHVKFARAPSTAAEAARAEGAVEILVRKRSPAARPEQVA